MKTKLILLMTVVSVVLVTAVCVIIAQLPKQPHSHSFADEWTYNEESHWHTATCEHTDVKTEQSSHDFGGGVERS